MIDQWIEARARVKRDKDGEIYKQLKLTLLFIKKNQRHISLLIVRSHYYPIRQISFHSRVHGITRIQTMTRLNTS